MPRKNMSASVGRSVLGAEQLEPRRLLAADLVAAETRAVLRHGEAVAAPAKYWVVSTSRATQSLSASSATSSPLQRATAAAATYSVVIPLPSRIQ